MKQLKEYLHFYRNIECLVYDDFSKDKFGYAIMTGVISNTQVAFQNFATSISLVKPVLKPLPSITDHQACAVASIAMRSHNRHYNPQDITYDVIHRNKPTQVCGIEVSCNVKGNKSAVVRIEDEAVYRYQEGISRSKDWISIPNSYEITIYLIDEGFDIFKAISDETAINFYHKPRPTPF